MQPNQPIPKQKHGSGERPIAPKPHAKLPFEGDASEESSKTDFGQEDQRTYLDQDGNHAQAGKSPPRKSGDSK